MLYASHIIAIKIELILQVLLIAHCSCMQDGSSIQE